MPSIHWTELSTVSKAEFSGSMCVERLHTGVSPVSVRIRAVFQQPSHNVGPATTHRIVQATRIEVGSVRREFIEILTGCVRGPTFVKERLLNNRHRRAPARNLPRLESHPQAPKHGRLADFHRHAFPVASAMGCGSSRAGDAAADAARLETLKTPKLSRRLSKGAAFFAGGAVSPSVSKDDDKLEKLNLPLNGDILEDELITEEEVSFLRDEIEPRLGIEIAAAILAAFDETSKARIGVPRPRRFARAFDREPGR